MTVNNYQENTHFCNLLVFLKIILYGNINKLYESFIGTYDTLSLSLCYMIRIKITLIIERIASRN